MEITFSIILFKIFSHIKISFTQNKTMKKPKLSNKKLIKFSRQNKKRRYWFALKKLSCVNKGKIKNKFFKKGNRIKTQLVIVKPISIIQPRKKILHKSLKSKLNQFYVVANYKQKQNLNNKLKSFNVFYLNKKTNKLVALLYLLLSGIVIGFVNGFWGGGGGMICVPILSTLLKLPEKKAHATAILIMLPLSVASFVVYLLKGTLEWNVAVYVTIGFVCGGVLGALLLKKINNILLRIVFSFVIIAGAIKLLI